MPESLRSAERSGSVRMTDADTVLLRAAGVPTPAVERRALNGGKTLLRLGDDAGIIKLARHPVGRSLLRGEAAAYRAAAPDPPYCRPSLLGFHDGDGATLLWLTYLHGSALSRWASLPARPGPFDFQAVGERAVADLLPEPETPWTGTWRPRIAERWSGEAVPAGPSHGDFVYWNLLRQQGGRLGLLDYEHYQAVAPAGIDRLFWRLSPLCRVATRHGWWEPLHRLAYRLASPVVLALALLRHGDRISREDSLPDTAALYDRSTVERRRRLMVLYAKLLGRVLA